MKKINLKGISKILSERELKNVLGGSGGSACSSSSCSGYCTNQWGAPSYCTNVNTSGTCKCNGN